jgi:hypothetical protein
MIVAGRVLIGGGEWDIYKYYVKSVKGWEKYGKVLIFGAGNGSVWS